MQINDSVTIYFIYNGTIWLWVEMGWEKPHEVQGPAAEEAQPQAQMDAERHFFVQWLSTGAGAQWGCGVPILAGISKAVWATWATSTW